MKHVWKGHGADIYLFIYKIYMYLFGKIKFLLLL